MKIHNSSGRTQEARRKKSVSQKRGSKSQEPGIRIQGARSQGGRKEDPKVMSQEP
jgi:hypothetical protein